MGKENKLIKDTLIYMIGNMGSKILSILIVPLYSFYFSPNDLGNYDLIVTTISLLIPIIIFQITDGIYRWLIVHPERKDDIIKSGVSIVLKNLIIINILAFVFMHYLNIQYGFLIILLLDSTIIASVMQQIIRGLLNNKLFALCGVVTTAVTLTLNLFQICILKLGVESLLISSIIANILVSILIFILDPKSRVNLKNKYNKELKRDLIKFSIPLIPNMINWWVMNASDRYVIKFFLGATANGIYAITYKFPSLLQVLCSMFNQAWQDNSIIEYSSKDRDKFYSNVFEKYYSLLFTITMILIPITKFVVLLVMHSSYHDAWRYTPFLYLGTIFSSFSSFYGTGYLSTKSTKGASYTSILGSIVNIIINIALIKFIGLNAASISTFIGFFVMWLARVVQTRKFFNIKINYFKFIGLSLLNFIWSIIILYSNVYIEIGMIFISVIIFIISNYKFIIDIINKFINKENRSLV